MTNSFSVMILAVGVAAGTLFSDVVINLFTDPPSIVCEEGWVTRCERITGGVEVVTEDAPVLSYELAPSRYLSVNGMSAASKEREQAC